MLLNTEYTSKQVVIKVWVYEDVRLEMEHDQIVSLRISGALFNALHLLEIKVTQILLQIKEDSWCVHGMFIYGSSLATAWK